MICKCANKPYNMLIATVFGLCIDNSLKLASFWFGWISVVCWFIAYFPQIRLTFLLKKSEALSTSFLIFWIVGDICNVSAVFILNSLFTQKVLVSFYIITDTVLIIEHVFFTCSKKKYMPQNTKVSCLEWTIYVVFLVYIFNDMFIYGAVGFVQLSQYEEKYDYCPVQPEVSEQSKVIGLILAYIAAASYISAKPGQIVKNYKRKSVQGLSLGLVISTCIGNVTQTLSVALFNKEYILQKLPFIIMYAIPAIFDFTILYQFYAYQSGRKERKYQKHDNQMMIAVEQMDDVKSTDTLRHDRSHSLNDQSSEIK
ncbi:Seven_transmembrane protein 1 [Hexamita inflata]|uniref:Seven transmembrane protein 1 n=1 Tax=Hexamita inflata TaxID=28002 RepID=A0AA86PVQ7_9EUKA|nr:Seven transmembrane protein 1 [Hexamita inflata]